MIENPLPSAPDSVKEKFYDDAIHPAAKQVGYIAETIVMAVNKKLEPIRQWATYGKENNEKLECEIQKRLANTSPENIISPPKEVAVPAIIANSYTDSDTLRSLYANLLAKAMDKTETRPHPSYVEIIKQLSPDEALLLKSTDLLKRSTPICTLRYQKASKFYGVSRTILHPQNIIRDFEEGYDLLSYHIPQITIFSPDDLSIMIDNFLRLKLIDIPHGLRISDKNAYSVFYKDSYVNGIQDILEANGTIEDFEVAHVMKMISPTPYGNIFYKICVE